MEKSAAEHIERMLDAALEQTFPASDPVALYVPEHIESPPAPLRQLP